jgi:hypothetical protein
MRLSHQMDQIIQTAKEEPYRAGSGSFLINGQPILRRSLARASTNRFDKLIYCGTCGVLLDHGQSSLDLTKTPDEVRTCRQCRQVKAFDDGFDDVARSVQLFQEWRQGRMALQRDPKKPPPKVEPPPPEAPFTLQLSPNYHSLHPINVYRRPTQQQQQQQQQQQAPHSGSPPEPSPIARRSRPAEGEYSAKGWYRDMVESEEPYKSPSKKYVKWMNGFGMQEPWERVLSAGDRLWLRSAASEKRLLKQQNGKVAPSKTVSFDSAQWTGFAPHDAQTNNPFPALHTRRLRAPWAGQDVPHFVDRSGDVTRRVSVKK